MRTITLTGPTQRQYSVHKPYTFLVHIPLGDAEARFNEIGSDRGGVLMTSLITNEHQGTFCGFGGILVEAPKPTAIKGMSRVDCGGEIADGRMDALDELLQPAPNREYNQIDMSFDGTRPVGVMLKVTPEGQELGDTNQNTKLKDIAQQHDVPAVTIEVAPSPLPTELSHTTQEFSNGNSLTTYDIPGNDEHFLRVDIAHGTFYHSPDATIISRSMLVDTYGQVSQRLTEMDKTTALEQLKKLHEQGSLSQAELQAVEQGFVG